MATTDPRSPQSQVGTTAAAAPLSRRKPGRGRYDRSASASERARQQHAALLLSVRQVAASDDSPTVAQFLDLAGVGRNTFYEHFQTVPDAIRRAVSDEAEILRRTLARGRETDYPLTPVDYAGALARGWVSYAMAHCIGMSLLQRHGVETVSEILEEAVRDTHRVMVDAGMAGTDLSGVRVRGVVGALRAIGADPGPSPEQAESVARDALLRLLR